MCVARAPDSPRAACAFQSRVAVVQRTTPGLTPDPGVRPDAPRPRRSGTKIGVRPGNGCVSPWPSDRSAERACQSRDGVFTRTTPGLTPFVARARARSRVRPSVVLRFRHTTGTGGGHARRTRGRGAAADRGGGCVVRVPRGDARAVGDALRGARAVGVE